MFLVAEVSPHLATHMAPVECVGLVLPHQREAQGQAQSELSADEKLPTVDPAILRFLPRHHASTSLLLL